MARGFEVTFYRPSALQLLVADARAGGFRAATQLVVIRHLIFGTSEKRRCLLCEARIRAGLSGKRLGLFGFLHAPGDDPTKMSGLLVCEDCVERHQTDAALRTAIAGYFETKEVPIFTTQHHEVVKHRQRAFGGPATGQRW